jgi:hypothetical protein
MNPRASGLAAMSVVSDTRPAFERLRALIPVEDLTPEQPDAADDDLHPDFGRDSLQHLVRTLGRQRKGHALLTGDPGVGKTALIRRLAIEAAAAGSRVGSVHEPSSVQPVAVRRRGNSGRRRSRPTETVRGGWAQQILKSGGPKFVAGAAFGGSRWGCTLAAWEMQHWPSTRLSVAVIPASR